MVDELKRQNFSKILRMMLRTVLLNVLCKVLNCSLRNKLLKILEFLFMYYEYRKHLHVIVISASPHAIFFFIFSSYLKNWFFQEKFGWLYLRGKTVEKKKSICDISFKQYVLNNLIDTYIYRQFCNIHPAFQVKKNLCFYIMPLKYSIWQFSVTWSGLKNRDPAIAFLF